MATSIGMHALADLALAAQGALFVLFVKSVLVLGVAALIAAMMHRRSAAARHLVWSIGLTTALALPVLSAVVPAWSIAGLPRVGWSDEAGRAAPVPVWVSLAAPKPELAPAPAPMPATAVAITGDNAPGTPAAAVDVTIASDASDGASVPEASVTAVAPEAAGAGAAVTVRVATAALHTGMLMTWPNRLSETGPLGPALLLVWLGGAVLLLLRLGLDAMTVSRLVRRATPAEEDLVLRQRLGDALLRCAVRDAELRVSDDIDVPVTWGIGSPVVLLPREATEWTAQRRALVLEHELAHVMRRDVCLHAAASVARALYWINPLAWLAVRELRNESEQACDDAVLARGVRPTRYAEELLSIARSIGAASVPALAPGLVRRPRIERRLRSLLDANMPRRLTTRRDTAVGAMAVLALALPLAAMRPVAPSREAAAPGPEFATPMALAMRVPRAIAASTAMPAMPAMPAIPAMPVVPAMPAMRARAAGAAAVLALTPGSAAPAPSAMRIVIPAIARGGSAESAPCEANGSSSSNMTTDNDGVRTWEVHWTGRDCGVDLRSQGKLQFADDLSDVTSISPGGWFDLSVRDGDHLTRLEIRPAAGGALEHRWTVDGTVRPWDASGRQWLSDFLIALDRRTAFAVDTRFPQLMSHGGVGAVLDEVGQMQGDYARGVYLQKLLAGAKLDAAQVRRVLDVAAAGIRSDYTMGQVLVTVATRYGLPDAGTRDAFLRAVDTIQSDYERSRTLNVLLDRSQPSTAEVAAVLQSASRLQSDYELARTLVAVAEHKLLEPSLFGKFLDDAVQLKSDYERSRVLRAVLGAGHLSDGDLARVIAAVSGIQSDYEKANVLIAVASGYDLTGDTRSKYEQAANAIGSSYDRGRALAALGAGRGREKSK